MASRIILKEPGIKEELWFDPDDTREMCHIPNDTVESLGNTASLPVVYTFTNDNGKGVVEMVGKLQDKACGDITSDTYTFDYMDFAHQLMHVAYTEGKLCDAQLLVDARESIMNQLRREYLNKYGVMLADFEIDGFGYVYVGETPVMTVEHIEFFKNSASGLITVDLSHGASVVNLRNAIAPLSARFTIQNGEKTYTVIIPLIDDDFRQETENGWLCTSVVLKNINGFILTDDVAESIVRPDELIVEKDSSDEETYQKHIWHLSKLETGYTPDCQHTAIDDSFPIDIFDL